MGSDNKPLKVGIVGASFSHSPDGRERFAIRAHIPALKALTKHYELSAVCTTKMQTANETAHHFNIPNAFDSVERMLTEMPDIDIVCVSVRPVSHYQVVMPALRAGKHVYCELPMGLNTGQAQEMYAESKKRNLRTMIGYQQHHHPALRHMSDLVREGFIGKPLTFGCSEIVSNYIVPRPSHRKWLFQSVMGGHPSYRSGRTLERVRSVLGQEIASICADMAIKVPERASTDTGGVIHSDQIDNMNYLVHMDNDVMGSVQVSYTGWFGSGDRFEVYGSEGMLFLTTDQSPSGWNKGTESGDPLRGNYRLYGARVDMDHFISSPTPPEHLQRKFREIQLPDSLYYVSGIHECGSAFPVAQAWFEFHKAIMKAQDSAPSFLDGLKLHRVHDAVSKSVGKRSWVDVDYSGI